MPPTSPTSPAPVRRSRTRRAGESAYGLLLLAKNLVVALIVLLLLCAGAWASWERAQPALTNEMRGTVWVTKCGDEQCEGTFAPVGGSHAGAPDKVAIDRSASVEEGDTPEVAVRPGTHEAVRTGPGGVLHACLPLGGALLLAALVVAGGLRMKRTAVTLGLLGAAGMAASWAVLAFSG